MGGVPPPVRLVLVHGSIFSAAQWWGYAERLGPDIELVTPDLPGHGARRAETFTWDGALASVAAAVADGAPGQRVVVAGHSLGGYVAAGYAAAAPDQVSGLGLLGATAEPRGFGAAAYRGLARLYGGWGPDRAGRLVERQLTRLGVDPPVVEAMVHAGLAPDAVDAAWRAVMEHGGARLVDGQRGPVLLAAGQYDQLRIGMRRFGDVARRTAYPVREVVVPKALHAFPMTHPGATVDALSWLGAATMEAL